MAHVTLGKAGAVYVSEIDYWLQLVGSESSLSWRWAVCRWDVGQHIAHGRSATDPGRWHGQSLLIWRLACLKIRRRDKLAAGEPSYRLSAYFIRPTVTEHPVNQCVTHTASYELSIRHRLPVPSFSLSIDCLSTLIPRDKGIQDSQTPLG